MDRINVYAPSDAHAPRLVAVVGGRFRANLNGGDAGSVVELWLDRETATQLVDLFDTLGQWLTDGDLAACQIGFIERSHTLLAATEGEPNDPTDFLLERTIQLQDRARFPGGDRAGEGNPRRTPRREPGRSIRADAP
jgi:hypothetical protein